MLLIDYLVAKSAITDYPKKGYPMAVYHKVNNHKQRKILYSLMTKMKAGIGR